MVSGDSTLQANGFGSPQKSPEPQPAARESEAAAEAAAGKGAGAEATLREELSSLILDLTGGGDLSMEDALSMSSVFDFIKNHSYTKSSDFAAAIVKLSKTKKQQQGARGDMRSSLVKDSRESLRKDNQKQEGAEVLPSASVSGAKAKSGNSSASKQSSVSGPLPVTSPRQRGSRLPVRVGASSSPRERRLEESWSEKYMKMTAPVSHLSKSKSQSASQILPHPDLKDDVKRSVDDSFTQKQQAANRRSSDKPKTDASKKIINQQRSGVASEGSRVSVSQVGSGRDNMQTVNGGQSTDQQSQGSGRPDINSKKRGSQAHSGQDAHVKLGADPSRSHTGSSNNRLVDQEQNKPPRTRYMDANMNDSRDTGKSFSAEAMKHLQDVPLNIPASGQKGKVPMGAAMKETYPLQVESNSNSSMYPSSTEARDSHDSRSVSQNAPPQCIMQTPPQRLQPATQVSAAPLGSHAQETSDLMQAVDALSNQSSPRGNQHNHHIPDGMEMSGLPSVQSRASHGASRAHAVGMEKGGLVKSRPLDFVHNAGDDGLAQQAKTLEASPVQGPSSQTQSAPSPEAQQQQSQKPTLLTGASLLRTEFAQKYLISRDTSCLTGETPLHPVDLHVNHQSVTRVLPDHLHPGAERPQQPSSLLHASLQPVPSSHQPFSQTPASLPQAADQRLLPPNTTLQTMDESAMSMYYELNEDMQQTTMLGGESSALGSFWGKSPLYQSTPALEVAKVSAVSLMGSRLDEHGNRKFYFDTSCV